MRVFSKSLLLSLVTIVFGCVLGVAGGGIVPVSTSPPGGLAAEDTPQVILITFDDAVNLWIYDRIQEISGHQNPDGSPVAFTFYVSTNYTDYYLVHKLHAEGHEIAAHTISHSTGNTTPFLTWIREIEGCREVISRYAGIPREEIRGFRAPYLQHNTAMFEALAELGFDYDSSIPEGPGLNSPDGANFIWPYTLHDGVQQQMWSGTGPSGPLPDLFEVPMWNLLDGAVRHNMDPGGSGDYLLQLFKDNFTQRYEGNRAPWALWLHATGWLSDQDRIDALNEFLEWALAHDDVWVVGVCRLVDWMRNPVPAADAAAVLSSPAYAPVPEEDALQNSFSTGSFRSVGHKATAYPTPTNAFLRNVAVEGVEVSWQITNQWSAGSFQAQLIATHNLSEPISGWKIEMSIGDAVVDGGWGPSNPILDFADGVMTVMPGRGGAAIAPGGTVLMTFGVAGTPDALGTPSGTFESAGFTPPEMSIGKGPASGQFQLNWNRVAPIYEIQRSTTLADDDWQTIETVYGREQTVITPDEPKVFYRLKAVQ